MARLAHISDLHFGAADPEALSALGAAINAASVEVIVITGDLTQAGRQREFEEASRYLKSLHAGAALITPGNHDAPVYSLGLRLFDPWRRFRRAFTSETDAAIELADATIVGLNSARRAGLSLDWSHGRLSRKQIRLAVDAFAAARANTVRIVALHHPVLRGPGRAGAAVVSRADEALAAFTRAGADLILSGHAHVASAELHDVHGRAMIVARAGTATSTRLRGQAPSFNLIEINAAHAHISVRLLGDEGYAAAADHRFVRTERGDWTPAGPETA